jgi:hypothetical protein
MAKKIDIFIIPINGIDVKFTYSNNVVSYQFTHEEKSYGNALNILAEGAKRATLEQAIKGGAILMLNAQDSINNLTNKTND